MIWRYVTLDAAVLDPRSRWTLLAVIIVASTVVPATTFAQQVPMTRADRVQWLQQHAAPIRTIDPGDEDFSDLAPLGAAIGKSRIVMLGEQSHGDGTTFLAKTRIIKYLHEKLGFDVLAFESGFYDVPKSWAFLRGGEDATKAVRRGVFGIWTGSAEFMPLVDYLGKQARSPHPLELTGFDDQFTATASTDFFRADLRTFLSAHDIDTLSLVGWTRARAMLDEVISNSWKKQKPTKEQFAEYLAGWAELRQRVAHIAVADSNVAYWQQLLKSIAALATDKFDSKAGPHDASSNNVRDAQMADNLIWLARDKYPGRKIIVWAATFHLMRNAALINTDSYRPGNYRSLLTMGQAVSAALQTQAYTVGFIASEGSAGEWDELPEAIPTPPHNGLDGMLASTNHGNAFIDFRTVAQGGAWLQQQLIAAPLGYDSYSADWTKVVDGMVYTRRMEASTRARPLPQYSEVEYRGAACAKATQLGCSLALEQFALIPAGTFQMGSSTGDSTAIPVHSVTISHPFYMQKTEVTQAQWRAMMGTNPGYFFACGDTCPVEQVNWDDIQLFLQRLNATTTGVTYRLPTEAEWEYAGRAGTTGDSYGSLDSIAWYASNAESKIHPAARKQANAWGLYDMIGNVWERVSDWYDPNYYAQGPSADPPGAASGSDRVLRGGTWGAVARYNSLTFRIHGSPSVGGGGAGFRLVRIP